MCIFFFFSVHVNSWWVAFENLERLAYHETGIIIRGQKILNQAENSPVILAKRIIKDKMRAIRPSLHSELGWVRRLVKK